jgi:hypothetical protein
MSQLTDREKVISVFFYYGRRITNSDEATEKAVYDCCIKHKISKATVVDVMKDIDSFLEITKS